MTTYRHDTIVPFKDSFTQKPKQFISIRTDITKQVEANNAIRASNERFEYVTKATFDAIWDWNLLTDDFYRGEEDNEIKILKHNKRVINEAFYNLLVLFDY